MPRRSSGWSTADRSKRSRPVVTDPAHCMDPYNTLGSASVSFEEEIKGSLKEGKLADIAVLSKDVFTIPEEENLNTDVVYTILGGKIIYSSEAE